MSIQTLKENLPDFAKDIRLNLSTVLTPEGAPGLSAGQIWGVALSCAYATRQSALSEWILADASSHLDEAHIEASKAAATIMAMNNTYYRFVHLVEDEEIKSMRANLRMMIIGRPGIEKADFELMSLAISSINGCGMCMTAHKNTLLKEGLTREAVQSSIRIASVINAAAQALHIASN